MDSARLFRNLPLFDAPAMGSAGLESWKMPYAPPPSREPWNPKALGAYYTDSQVADFLVWWAIRDPADTVLDPSFGGGVFLRSAGKRLRDLKADPSRQILGIELDPLVHEKISALLSREFAIVPANLVVSDFFAVIPERFAKVDVIVGNPPFIRYQRFSGDSRKRALRRTAEAGVKLSELASSWLPFLIHSIRFLRPGGRLAMVIPFEIGHASYARPILDHLSLRFETIHFLTFRRKLFPDLSEDTLLLLAENRRDSSARASFQIRDLDHAGDLACFQKANQSALGGLELDAWSMASGEERLIESLIPSRARDLYRELRLHDRAERLGELADVGIGYVTGANEFFHFNAEGIKRWQIPERFLRPCVRRGRALSGLQLTQGDWENLLPSAQTGYLLQLPAKGDLPASVQRYLKHGMSEGVHTGFKCRNRIPWYRVPHVYQPDCFLSYMSGAMPRLVANKAGVVAPNTLHILRIHPGNSLTGDELAALWQTSLTRLSVEIEGHALGGGMLKLEPTEAERIILPAPNATYNLKEWATELDDIARKKGDRPCSDRADLMLLRRGLGLSAADVRLLRDAADTLRQRRTSRSIV